MIKRYRGYAFDVIPHVRTDIRHFEWQDSSMGKSCCAVGCVNDIRKVVVSVSIVSQRTARGGHVGLLLWIGKIGWVV